MPNNDLYKANKKQRLTEYAEKKYGKNLKQIEFNENFDEAKIIINEASTSEDIKKMLHYYRFFYNSAGDTPPPFRIEETEGWK